MSWTQENRIASEGNAAQRAFQDTMEAAWRIIPDNHRDPFFVQAARDVLAGVLHGLGHSSPRRVSVVELAQTVQSYERLTRALRATPEGLEIYRQHFGHSTTVLMCVLSILEDRVLDLVDRK